MSGLIAATPQIPAMGAEAIGKVRRLESTLSGMAQVEIRTDHVIHGDMYARTIHIPAGVALTGALIKVATLLIINGHVTVFTGDDSLALCGYHVIPASAGRKQVFLAHADTDLTMVFASKASTVEEAEAEFTDEANLLRSREYANRDTTTITGE